MIQLNSIERKRERVNLSGLLLVVRFCFGRLVGWLVSVCTYSGKDKKVERRKISLVYIIQHAVCAR